MPSPLRKTARPAVLVISSLVADGSVGGRLACFALERLGFPVWFVPTVNLPRHPGRQPSVRDITSADYLRGCLDDLVKLAEQHDIAAVLTGYIGDAAQIPVVADAVSRLKAIHPRLIYLCDPVLGDGDKLYISDAVANAMRDQLWPICDIATPNVFELCWLERAANALQQGMQRTAPAMLADLAGNAAPARIAVTSVCGLMANHIGNLLTAPQAPALLFEHLAMPHAPHGTGDLFAALLLGHHLLTGDLEQATERASSALFELTARAARSGLEDLPLIGEQTSLERPMAMVSKRVIGTSRPTVGGKTPTPKPRPL
tara:strand:- start:4664 stop:5608 length:945 start_codon:yes stop_codon:yes gene_type:complete